MSTSYQLLHRGCLESDEDKEVALLCQLIFLCVFEVFRGDVLERQFKINDVISSSIQEHSDFGQRTAEPYLNNTHLTF